MDLEVQYKRAQTLASDPVSSRGLQKQEGIMVSTVRGGRMGQETKGIFYCQQIIGGRTGEKAWRQMLVRTEAEARPMEMEMPQCRTQSMGSYFGASRGIGRKGRILVPSVRW
jgi:hypothetical protein